jgi:hypothetical protein
MKDNYNKNIRSKKQGTDERPNITDYDDAFKISKNMDILEKLAYLERNKYMYENKDIYTLDAKTARILYDSYGYDSISPINMKAGGLFSREDSHFFE